MLVSGWKWYSGIKDGPLPSPAILSIVSVCEENPDRKKNHFVTMLQKKLVLTYNIGWGIDCVLHFFYFDVLAFI